MKISKERLIEIIKEEIDSANNNLNTSDLQKSMGASTSRTKARELGDRLGSSQDISNKERNIISQMMDLLEIASVEIDIDKGNTYTILKRAYALIAQAVKKDRESS